MLKNISTLTFGSSPRSMAFKLATPMPSLRAISRFDSPFRRLSHAML